MRKLINFVMTLLSVLSFLQLSTIKNGWTQTGSVDKPPELRRIEAEEKHAPPFNELSKLYDPVAKQHPMSDSVHLSYGFPTWYVGIIGPCWRGEMPSAAMANMVRSLFAKYTTTPVKVEKRAIYTIGNSKVTFEGCTNNRQDQ
jgi:hypothetical protein